MWAKFKAVLSANSGQAAVVSHLYKTAVQSDDVASFVSDANILCTGDLDTVTMRGSANCALYGSSRAYVGCREGFGMVVKDSEIGVGKLTGAKGFAGASIDHDFRITIKSDGIMTRWKKSKLAVLDDAAWMRFKNFGLTLDSSGCKVRAKKIDVDA